MRVSHDVFRHMLSYKDPTRQVGIKGGIKTDSASAWPINVDDELALLQIWHIGQIMVEGKLYYSREEHRNFTHICIWKGVRALFGADGIVDGQPGGDYKRIKSFKLHSRDNLRPPSLQCEACGPDLTLYDYIPGSNAHMPRDELSWQILNFKGPPQRPGSGRPDKYFLMDFENSCLTDWRGDVPKGPNRHENPQWASMIKSQVYPYHSDVDWFEYCEWVSGGGGDEWFVEE